MTIPKRIKVGAHSITIRFADCGERAGHFDPSKNEIVIDPDNTQSQQGATFFHELFHALNSELDHALLESLSQQLFQVLHDNKMLK